VEKRSTQLSISMLNGYSTVFMKINSLSILFDPLEIAPDQYDVDLVIVTHEHMDHFDKNLVMEISWQTNAVVLTTPYVARLLNGLANVVSLKPGDFYTINEVNIFAEDSNHTANDPLTFIVKSSDIAVFHPNDSDYFPELEAIGIKYKPDVMIYMGSSERNLRAIGFAVRPKIIVSYAHPMLKELAVPNIKVKALKQFEWFHYPDETT